MSYLNEGLFLVCLVYLILCQNILDLTRNIKNFIFCNVWLCYVVFVKNLFVLSL